MDFPLELKFRIIALAPQITLQDASGRPLCYIKQKLFKLKEKIEVFRDDTRSEKICEINADRIIDFNAAYAITDASGEKLGSLKRAGMRSLWRTHYAIQDASGADTYILRETNPWTRLADGLFESIPIIGSLSGYVFQPRYQITNAAGEACYMLIKKPAFFESVFSLEREQETGDDALIMLSVVLITLLERQRG